MRTAHRTPAAALAALLCALACSTPCAADEAFKGVDVTGQGYGGTFHLVGHDGKPRTPASFSGKVLMLSFGFTHCPDVCPTTLAALAQTSTALGEDAGRIQVLFVTVDPERDTPAVLRSYVTAFNPAFLGLSGGAAATREAARAFKVFYQKVRTGGVQARGRGDYTMDHSTGYYLIDKRGRTRVLCRYGQPVADMVHDIRLLLRE